MQEMEGASSGSGEVWQGTAGRRRCCPLIQGRGGGERKGGRSSEVLVGWRRRGSPTAGDTTDTETGSETGKFRALFDARIVIHVPGPRA